MLDRTDQHLDAAIRAFTGRRAALRDRLLEACSAEGNRSNVEEFASSGAVRPGPPKRLFQITDGRTARMVHNALLELESLLSPIEAAHRQAALDAGRPVVPLDLVKERGLWLPEVIDAERGDYQVNVMVYTNRAIRVLPVQEALAMVAAEGADDPALLKMQAIGRTHGSVRLCRDAGQAYRLQIRGAKRRTEVVRNGNPVSDDYELHNLREFAIVLGSVRINLPSQRPRKTRKDALNLGEPLHTFRGVVDRNLWAVYPAT